MLYAGEPGLLPEVPRRERAPGPGQTVMDGTSTSRASSGEQALVLVMSHGSAERVLSPGG